VVSTSATHPPGVSVTPAPQSALISSSSAAKEYTKAQNEIIVLRECTKKLGENATGPFRQQNTGGDNNGNEENEDEDQ
jgi:hypothetical protein